MTLKFDVWPWKTIGHLFYATSSFLQHFIAIGEFKLELESGNVQSRSKSTNFLAVWPWNLTDDLQTHYGTSPKQYQAICIISSSYVNSNWSYSPKTPNLGQIRRFLEPRDLEIWQMTFKNNRAPFLCYFKLCAAFRSIGELKLELQSGNAQSGSNSTIFRAVWPSNLTDDLEKQ